MAMSATWHLQWCSSSTAPLLCSRGGGNLRNGGGRASFKRESGRWRGGARRRRMRIRALVDPWSPTTAMSVASQLFAASLLPYAAFLYFITKSKSAPTLTLFGFYFLLAFVGATSVGHDMCKSDEARCKDCVKNGKITLTSDIQSKEYVLICVEKLLYT